MVEEIVALIDALIERGHAYAVDGDVYFRVRSLPEYGELSHRDVDQMDQGEGVEGAGPQGGSARLRALEGAEADGGHGWDAPWGARPAGLAHRVLRDGRGDARRAVRDPRRRQRPDLPPPRERGGADAGRPRAAARADLDAQRDARSWATREDGQVRRQHPRRSREVLDEVGPRRAALVLLRGPLPPAAGVHRASGSTTPRGGSSGSATPGGGSCRATRRRRWRRTATRSSTRSPTTTTRRARWRRWPSGSARPTARDGPVGDAHLREMLGVLGLENLLERDEGAPRRGRRAGRAARRRRARRATSPRPTACATSCARAAGRCATAPAAPS